MTPTEPTEQEKAARVAYLLEHRKCLDRIVTIARMVTGPGSPTVAALSTSVIFIFNLAGTGTRMPGAFTPNGLGGIDIDAPDQRGGPAAYRITADGQVQKLRMPDIVVTDEAPEPDKIVRLVQP